VACVAIIHVILSLNVTEGLTSALQLFGDFVFLSICFSQTGRRDKI